MQPLDKLDHKILQILQADNTTSQRDIGDAIGLSAPAVQRRITRLRETGVIKQDISIIDPEYLGSPIIIVVQVEMETDKVTIINEAKERFRKTPQVQQCYYVTGEVDFILIIMVFTMKEYEALTHVLFFNNPGVKRFKSSINMDIVKYGLAFPIPE